MEDVDLSGVKDTVKEVVGTETVDALKSLYQQITDAVAQPLVKLVVTVLVCLLAIRILLKLVDRTVGRLKIEKTACRFIRSVLHAVVYVIVLLAGAGALGIEITSLVALFSVFSAALALAAQDVLGNFFGGLLLMGVKPFLVGDYISTSAGEGTVVEVGLLNTQLKTIDNQIILIPNGTISAATITNVTRSELRRVDLNFTVSYDAPIEKVKAVMQGVICAHPMSLSEPEPPFARVTALGENSVTYTLRVWCKGTDYWDLRFDLLEGIKKAFDEEGIEIPYDRLNVRMRQDAGTRSGQ